jgi:hypothetical protein
LANYWDEPTEEQWAAQREIRSEYWKEENLVENWEQWMAVQLVSAMVGNWVDSKER